MAGRSRTLAVLFVGITCFFTLTETAKAALVLDFGIAAPTAGSISHTLGATPLVGSGINVDDVTGLPGGPNNVPCVGCILSFITGNLTGTTVNTWSFGGGGSITVTGAVPAAGAAGTLLTGSFSSATVTNSGNNFDIAGAAFVDTKNPALLTFFGLPSGPYNGNFNISFSALGLPPGAFTSTTVFSGDILNTPVPEPATVMLLGTGLLGLGYFVRPWRSVRRSV